MTNVMLTIKKKRLIKLRCFANSHLSLLLIIIRDFVNDWSSFLLRLIVRSPEYEHECCGYGLGKATSHAVASIRSSNTNSPGLCLMNLGIVTVLFSTNQVSNIIIIGNDTLEHSTMCS